MFDKLRVAIRSSYTRLVSDPHISAGRYALLTNEELEAVPTLLAMVIPGAPQDLIGDNAYDSDKLDSELREYRIELISSHRTTRINRDPRSTSLEAVSPTLEHWKIVCLASELP